MNPRLITAILATALVTIGASAVISTASAAETTTAQAGDGSRMRQMMRARIEQRQTRGPQAEIDLKLTTDQLRDVVAGHLALSGNPNLKVGKVTAKDDGVAAVEIVTKTGALVDTLELSTKTGRPARITARPAMGGMGPGGMGSNAGRDLKLGRVVIWGIPKWDDR